MNDSNEFKQGYSSPYANASSSAFLAGQEARKEVDAIWDQCFGLSQTSHTTNDQSRTASPNYSWNSSTPSSTYADSNISPTSVAIIALLLILIPIGTIGYQNYVDHQKTKQNEEKLKREQKESRRLMQLAANNAARDAQALFGKQEQDGALRAEQVTAQRKIEEAREEAPLQLERRRTTVANDPCGVTNYLRTGQGDIRPNYSTQGTARLTFTVDGQTYNATRQTNFCLMSISGMIMLPTDRALLDRMRKGGVLEVPTIEQENLSLDSWKRTSQ